MAIIKEFFTDGNLIINNTGGLNTNERDKHKSWKLYRVLNTLVLNKNGNKILELKLTETKTIELMQFFNKHKINFTIE